MAIDVARYNVSSASTGAIVTIPTNRVADNSTFTIECVFFIQDTFYLELYNTSKRISTYKKVSGTITKLNEFTSYTLKGTGANGTNAAVVTQAVSGTDVVFSRSSTIGPPYLPIFFNIKIIYRT
jgi:hypothetical protein